MYLKHKTQKYKNIHRIEKFKNIQEPRVKKHTFSRTIQEHSILSLIILAYKLYLQKSCALNFYLS